MKKYREKSPHDKRAIKIARKAFDEINRTKEFEFGVTLFTTLMQDFTDLRDDLESMLKYMQTNLASADN